MRWGPEVLPHILYGFWWLLGCIPIAFVWTERNPETALELGVASMVAAFAFLALGLARSLVPPRTTGSSTGQRWVSS